MPLLKRLLPLLAVLLLWTAAAQAQCPTVNSSPGFTYGGTVFGLNNAQWNTFFNVKADANNGTLCNATLINPTILGSNLGGIIIHATVNLATTAALPANTYNNGAIGVGATLTATSVGALTVDGVPAVVGYRILVDAEALQADNGVYTVTAVGSGSAPYVLTRATDFNTSVNITPQSYFFVTQGLVNNTSGWLLTTSGAIVIGTTNLVFTKLTSAPTARGLSLSNTLNACNYMSCSGQTTTGAITAGTNNLVLGSAIDFGTNPQCVAPAGNGCFIDIAGAGEPIGAGGYNIGPPTAFSAASYCSVFTITATTVTGSNIVSGVSSLYGLRAAMAVTGTGIPSTTTIKTISADPAALLLTNNATASGTVTLTVQDPCATTRYYRIASYGPNLSLGAPLAAVSTTGAVQPSWLSPDCLDFTRPTGTPPLGYVVWMSTDGGATYHFWSLLNNEGSGACVSATGGPDQNVGQSNGALPWWIPDNPAMIGSSGISGYLATYVVSGQGTTTLVLGNNAGTTVSGAYVQHDDSAGWSAWAALINGQKGVIPGYTLNGTPTVVNTSSTLLINTSNTSVLADPNAQVNFFGDAALYAVNVGTLNVNTPILSTTYLPPQSENFSEGSHCLPLNTLAGLSVGQYLVAEQFAPAGPTGSAPYFFASQIYALTCNTQSTGVDMLDTTGVTMWSAGTANGTNNVTGSGNITINTSGSPGAVITVAASGSGPFSGAVSYTVQSGDTTTIIARNLALLIDNIWGQSGVFAYHSTNVLTITVPSVDQSTIWAIATTGTQTFSTSATGSFGIWTWSPLTHVTLDGLTIDCTDAAPMSLTNGVFAAALYGTVNSSFRNFKLTNVQLGTAFYHWYSYKDVIDNINVKRGANGTSNSYSYDAVTINYSMRDQISNISDTFSSSFGFGMLESMYDQVDNISEAVAEAGRGVKLGAGAGDQYVGITSDNNSNKNLAICCGMYNSDFTEVAGTGGSGLNAFGISTFDDWVRNNRFSGFRFVNNDEEDIDVFPADIGNQWSNGQVGQNANQTTGIFPGIQDYSGKYKNLNGCGSAYGDGNGHVICGEPMLRAISVSNQSVTSGVNAQVVFGDVLADIGQYWNSGSNAWQPQVAGTYQICVSIAGMASPWSGEFQGFIQKDTGQLMELQNSVPTNSGNNTITGCANVSLNGTTDTIGILANLVGTTPLILGASSARQTQINIQRIGPLTGVSN